MDRHKPETKKRLQAEYRERNREKLRQYQRDMKKALREEVLDKYGRVCVYCNYSDTRALQIDHINNDGNVERKELGGKNFSGWRFYSHLKKLGWPEGYQTLCANCNVIKHIENKAL